MTDLRASSLSLEDVDLDASDKVLKRMSRDCVAGPLSFPSLGNPEIDRWPRSKRGRSRMLLSRPWSKMLLGRNLQKMHVFTHSQSLDERTLRDLFRLFTRGQL